MTNPVAPDALLSLPGLKARLRLWKIPGLRRLLITAAALLIAAAASFSGMAPFLDEQAGAATDRLFSRTASGQVHVVEIDARSIAAFETWPWPRSRHAELIRKLDAAQVATLAFDVDFSSASAPEQDAALADALDAFGGTVVLPTFRQRASGNSTEMVESLPIPVLREHAFTGSVNVHPDTDGTLRSYSFGTVTQGIPRPSLAAMLADVQGQVSTGFVIDTSIDPATIPRHSYIDVVSGKVPAEVLKGKRILVGATAIELGDRYVIPTHGTLPGVVVQALAAETLLQGRNYADLASWAGILIALIGGFLAQLRGKGAMQVEIYAATATIVILASTLLDLTGTGHSGMATGLILIAAMAALNLLFDMLDELWTSRFVDARSGLPGERPLLAALRQTISGQLVVMQFRRGQETIDVLDATLRQRLFEQIAERVRLAAGPVELFGLGSNGIAWRNEQAPGGDLMDLLDGIAALFLTHFDVQGRSIVIVPVFGTTWVENREPRRVLGQALLAASRAAGSSLRALAFSEALEQGADLDQRILAEFDDAMAEGQVHLVFQAKLAIAEKRVAGFEALARWTHPELGPIPPDQFVPVLEEAGRMRALTLFGIRESLARMAAWREESFDLSVAVNVSAPLLNDRAFARQALALIDGSGELATRLVLEITESAAFERQEAALAFLANVRKRGVKVSVDDYGTGQSTMTYLKTFPADEIKIDKSFITSLPDSTSDQILVRSTIELAHELGFKVVAEGVETEAILALLASYGCDTAQGWHIARPLPATRLLDAQRYPAKLLPANERKRAA